MSQMRVFIDKVEIIGDLIASISVDSNIDESDMAVVVLKKKNQSVSVNITTNLELGKDVRIMLDGKPLFQGKIVGIEPSFPSGNTAIRAMAQLPRIYHRKTSRPIMIPETQVQKNHSSLPKKKSDLEFLLQRAARINYELIVGSMVEIMSFRKREVGGMISGVTQQYDAQKGYDMKIRVSTDTKSQK